MKDMILSTQKNVSGLAKSIFLVKKKGASGDLVQIF